MRRTLATACLAAVLVPSLAACSGSSSEEGGSAESSSSASAEGSFPVQVSDNVGKAPKVDFRKGLNVDQTQSEVVVEGDGATVGSGEQLLVNLYLANATTGQKIGSSYDQGVPAQTTLSQDAIFPAAYDALLDQKIGSRIAVVAQPADGYGAKGAPQLKLKKGDDLVIVMDIVSGQPQDPLTAPDGEPQDVPAGLPTVESKGDVVTGLDFAKADKKPSDQLQVITLVAGDGPEVRDPSLVTLNYLGQVYGAAKPFDQSFDGDAVTFPIGVGNLIPAWDEGLVGVPAGSRVMLVVPADKGYGEDGQPAAGIKGGDTLVFVIDILGVG